MIYSCKCCNFETNIKTDYSRHLKTVKHINNFKTNTYCNICNKNYSTNQTFKYHYKTKHSNNIMHSAHNNIMHSAQNKNITLENIKTISDNINKMQENVSDNINKLEQNVANNINKSNKEVVKVVNKAINRASSLIKYLMENHKTTPPLRKLQQKASIDLLRIDYNCPLDNTKNPYALEKTFISDYRNDTFIKNICKSILNIVNYKNPDKQPIWNTDCSRFHYVIKTAIDKWDEDKAGIKFTEYVIKPVLDYVAELINTYRTEYLATQLDKNKCTTEELLYILKLMGHACDLQTELNNLYFIKPILKELSPYLRFLESELEEIEQEELEELEEKEKLQELEKIQSDLESLIK